MTMRICLLLLGFLITSCRSQVDRDWSLEAMCKFHSASYSKRQSQSQVGTGDTCKDVKIQYPTSSNHSAQLVCEATFPYHITRAVFGSSTICDVETGLVCSTNWVQMYGRCYQLKRKMMFRKEAGDYCKKIGAGVAYLHRDMLATIWQGYFTRTPRIWIEASDVYKNNLIYNTGDEMMFLFDGYSYGMKGGSIIQVDGNQERAFALCEYTPQMTREESTYLLRRYSEIYHSGFSTERAMYIRTANHLIADDKGREKTVHEYCRKVMKPFVSENGVNSIAGAPSYEMFHEGLRLSPNQEQHLDYYRSTSSYRGKKEARNQPNCQNKAIKADNQRLIVSSLNATCDGATWSAYLRKVKDQKWKMNLFSDARSAPSYCEAIFNAPTYGGCPPGYTEYMRVNGVKWCHKYIHHNRNYTEANEYCQKKEEGAYLTGFESKDEFLFLWDLIKADPNYDSKGHFTFIGGQRRDVCRWGGVKGVKGWRDGDRDCSRKLVFEWRNKAAYNPPFFDGLWGVEEPNYLEERENCLEIRANTDDNTFYLNDRICDAELPFICGREAYILPNPPPPTPST